MPRTPAAPKDRKEVPSAKQAAVEAAPSPEDVHKQKLELDRFIERLQRKFHNAPRR